MKETKDDLHEWRGPHHAQEPDPQRPTELSASRPVCRFGAIPAGASRYLLGDTDRPIVKFTWKVTHLKEVQGARWCTRRPVLTPSPLYLRMIPYSVIRSL